jgi:hypothetical protein
VVWWGVVGPGVKCDRRAGRAVMMEGEDDEANNTQDTLPNLI